MSDEPREEADVELPQFPVTEENPGLLISYVMNCLRHQPQRLGAYRMRDFVLETKRANKKRPYPQVVLQVDDMTVKALRGAPGEGKVELVIAIVPREVCDAVDQAAKLKESGLVLPTNEPKPAGKIIKA